MNTKKGPLEPKWLHFKVICYFAQLEDLLSHTSKGMDANSIAAASSE